MSGFRRFRFAGPRAASLMVGGFGAAARFAGVAGFREATCAGDLPCFDEPLKISDSQPALASLGRSTNAATAAMTVRRRHRKPKSDPANFFPDGGNPNFPRIIFCSRVHDGMAHKTTFYRDFAPRVTGNRLRPQFDERAQKFFESSRLSAPLPRLDLVEFGNRSFKFGIEEPHRIKNFAEGRRCSCPVSLPKGEDAVVAQISHDLRVGNSVAEQVA